MSSIKNITTNKDYSNLIKIMFFKKKWTASCEIMEFIILKLENTFKDQIKVIHVDYDSNLKMLTHYRIKNYPTILILIEDNLIESYEEITPFNTINNRLQKIINKNK